MIKPKKSLGQNFLINQDVIKKIVNIVDICNKLNCKEYITGKGSDDYLDLDEFKKNNISLNQDVNFNDKYLQINGTFMRDLSVLDFYFNCYDKKNKTNII